MKNRKMKGILITVFSIIVLVSFYTPLIAESYEINCGEAPNALRLAFNSTEPALQSGDTLLVSGTCNGGILIGPNLQNITIDCNKAGTIALSGSGSVLSIKAQKTTITECTIDGGMWGITVSEGGTATITDNTIQNATNFGVFVTRQSFATISRNDIQNNGQHGISIYENGSAAIGASSPLDNIATCGNHIQNNGQNGIAVAFSSYASIVGNTINNNGRNGIGVNMVSIILVSGNDISGNVLDGVYASGGSGVNLGNELGNNIYDLPNTVSTPNGKYGVECNINAYIAGHRGGLGKPRLFSNCVDGTIN